MATFSITHRMRLDGVAVVQTLTNVADLTVGQQVTIAGVGDGFDGTDHVGARDHDLAQDRFIQLQYRLQHLPFVFVDDALLLRCIDQLVQVLFTTGLRPLSQFTR